MRFGLFGLFGLILGLVMPGCAITAKFPVSDITPAAVISATKKLDKNNNFSLSVKAKTLASPDRLTPSMNTYIVWVVEQGSVARNAGQLQNKNGKVGILKTVVPYDFSEIFITAEEEAGIQYPRGIEISRTFFK